MDALSDVPNYVLPYKCVTFPECEFNIAQSIIALYTLLALFADMAVPVNFVSEFIIHLYMTKKILVELDVNDANITIKIKHMWARPCFDW